MTGSGPRPPAPARRDEESPAATDPPALADRLRDLAQGLDAAGAHVFLACLTGEGLRLKHGLSAGKAGDPLRELPDRIAEIASETAVPLYWSDGPSDDFGPWAERIVAGPGAGPGLVLPLCDEQARRGLAVFHGPRLAATEEAVLDVHAACHALFAALVDVQPLPEGDAPAMTRRELQCLKLTANGLTSEDIARHLGLSVHTANQYLSNTAQKLNAVNRIHAVAKALRGGLIE